MSIQTNIYSKRSRFKQVKPCSLYIHCLTSLNNLSLDANILHKKFFFLNQNCLTLLLKLTALYFIV